MSEYPTLYISDIMPRKSSKKNSTQEGSDPLLDAPPFVSKWSFTWIAFPYSGEYLGENEIINYFKKNNIPLIDHTVFQVSNWSCELIGDEDNWAIKSNGKIIIRYCLSSTHKCKECGKVYSLPWPFHEWSNPELANYCNICRMNKHDENLTKANLENEKMNTTHTMTKSNLSNTSSAENKS